MDVDLVRLRVETKYRLSDAEAAALVDALPERRGGWVSTVYLDRPDLRLVRAAARDPRRAVKIRLRDYGGDAVWVELKERDGERSRKRRFPVPRAAVDDVLSGASAPDDPEAVDTLRRIRALAPGRLVPLGESRYLRVSAEADGARLTVDRRISYRRGALTWREEGAVAEMKRAVGAPARWCEALLAGRAPVEYSKFGRICGEAR